MPTWFQIVALCIWLVFRTPTQIRIATTTITCETGGTFDTTLHNRVLARMPDGTMQWREHKGVGQVDPGFHGAVPSGLVPQLEQVETISSTYGWWPWDCAPADWRAD